MIHYLNSFTLSILNMAIKVKNEKTKKNKRAPQKQNQLISWSFD